MKNKGKTTYSVQSYHESNSHCLIESELFLKQPIFRYNATTHAMMRGYPKRTAEVFNGATGEIDAAFDSKIIFRWFKLICITMCWLSFS